MLYRMKVSLIRPEPSSKFQQVKCGRAFTLVELITVMAIITVMVTLLVPAFTSIGKANALNTSGNHVVNLINLARENSMSKNVMTALVVLTDSSMADANRSLVLMELDPTTDGSQPSPGNWRQISGWETLGSGVIVDPNLFTFNKSSDSAGEPGVPTPAFPAIQHSGKIASSYGYLVFLPGGNLLGSNASQIQLVEGIIASGGAVYTRRTAAGGGPANYYNITVLAATGRIKIDRP